MDCHRTVVGHLQTVVINFGSLYIYRIGLSVHNMVLYDLVTAKPIFNHIIFPVEYILKSLFWAIVLSSQVTLAPQELVELKQVDNPSYIS